MIKNTMFYISTYIAILNLATVLFYITFTPTEYLIATIPGQLFKVTLAYIPVVLTLLALTILIMEFKVAGLKNWRVFLLTSLAFLPTTLFFVLSILFGGRP